MWLTTNNNQQQTYGSQITKYSYNGIFLSKSRNRLPNCITQMNLKEGPKRTELGTEEDLQGPIQKEDLSEQSKTHKKADSHDPIFRKF